MPRILPVGSIMSVVEKSELSCAGFVKCAMDGVETDMTRAPAAQLHYPDESLKVLLALRLQITSSDRAPAEPSSSSLSVFAHVLSLRPSSAR